MKMNKILFRWIALLAAMLLCLSGCGANTQGGEPTEEPSGSSPALKPIVTDAPEVGIVPNWSDKSMNGLCLGLTGAHGRKLDTAQLIDLLGVMNVIWK